MLSLIIGLLTFILVLICAVLIVLILAQLPKKDAGAGLAFGAGTAEAIFGAGAGTPLAQITKYCAGIFLGLALTLSALNAYRSGQADRLIEQEAAHQAANAPATAEEESPTETPTVPTTIEGPEPGADASATPDAETTEGETEADTTPEITEPADPNLSQEPLTQPEETPATEPNPNN